MLTTDLAHLAVVYLVSTSYDVLGGSGPQFYILENQSSALTIQPLVAVPGCRPVLPALSCTLQLPAHLVAGGRLLLKETGREEQ